MPPRKKARDDFNIEKLRSTQSFTHRILSCEADAVNKDYYEAFAHPKRDIRHSEHPDGLITGVRVCMLSYPNPYDVTVKVFNKEEKNILSFPIQNNGLGWVVSMRFMDAETLVLLISHTSTSASLRKWMNFFVPDSFFILEVWKINKDDSNQYQSTFLTESHPIYEHKDPFNLYSLDPKLLQMEKSKITVFHNNMSHVWEYDSVDQALKEINPDLKPKSSFPCTIL
jgi:hypothetical protein